jgi:hypothetical protein
MIEPLFVIDQAHQRPSRSHLRQQAQHGQADQKPVRHRPRTHPEGSPQRITLRPRQTLCPIQHRRQQLMQPGERQLHLRLDTRGGHHPAARRPVGQIFQQRRLARSRLATYHQSPALTRPDRRQEPAHLVTFGATAQQLRRASPHGRICGPRHDTDAIPHLGPAHQPRRSARSGAATGPRRLLTGPPRTALRRPRAGVPASQPPSHSRPRRRPLGGYERGPPGMTMAARRRPLASTRRQRDRCARQPTTSGRKEQP